MVFVKYPKGCPAKEPGTHSRPKAQTMELACRKADSSRMSHILPNKLIVELTTWTVGGSSSLNMKATQPSVMDALN